MTYQKERLLLGCDVDGTLIARYEADDDTRRAANTALEALTGEIAHRRWLRGSTDSFYFGTVTGNTLATHATLETDNLSFGWAVGFMQFISGSVGTEIKVRDAETAKFEPVKSWFDTANWDPCKIREVLLGATALGISMQPDAAQTQFKVGMHAKTTLSHTAYTEQVRTLLSKHDIRANPIYSSGLFLDILPMQANGEPVDKGAALVHAAHVLAERDGLDNLPSLMFAGDSENDWSGLLAAVDSGGHGIVPGNARADFKDHVRGTFGDDVYIAEPHFAAGVMEGLEHFVPRKV